MFQLMNLKRWKSRNGSCLQQKIHWIFPWNLHSKLFSNLTTFILKYESGINMILGFYSNEAQKSACFLCAEARVHASIQTTEDGVFLRTKCSIQNSNWFFMFCLKTPMWIWNLWIRFQLHLENKLHGFVWGFYSWLIWYVLWHSVEND